MLSRGGIREGWLGPAFVSQSVFPSQSLSTACAARLTRVCVFATETRAGGGIKRWSALWWIPLVDPETDPNQNLSSTLLPSPLTFSGTDEMEAGS